MNSLLRALAVFVATGAYTGFFPIAPGTVGSVLGILIERGLRATGSDLVYGLVIVALSVAGVLSSRIAEEHFARKDPSHVVVDEVAGMLVSLYLIPVSWIGLLVGFLLFRLLDIVKPFPCRRAEKLHGGLGIMADDLIAGVYVNLLLRLASLVWPALLSAGSMGANP
ncbi:MAG TPA: phosphatidylglycerophosphatase A [Vicinamibacteria bacterium]|jgi:phosphatidylglycerophosphatase A